MNEIEHDTGRPHVHRVAVVPGDGIGGEVIAEAIRVLDAAAGRFGFRLEYETFAWGSDHFRRLGRMMPEDGIRTLARFDAILLGAVGDPGIQDNITLNGLLLPIRRGFDQYACVRPARTFPGVPAPLARTVDIDLVVVRENTEGEYAQVGGTVHHATGQEVVAQASIFTRHGTERIIRYAFELARSRRKRLASITKSNAQGHSMAFWDRVFDEVAEEFPDVETESVLVDAACVHLIRRPESFDVIVASNLFGDIMSDLTAAVTGSLGLAPSANLNPERAYPSMFEPVHGSAPDIVGRGIANPVAAILSAAQMLDSLDESAAARSVEEAVVAALSDPGRQTPDLGGRASTSEVGTAIADRVAAG